MLKFVLTLTTALIASETLMAAEHSPVPAPKGVTIASDKHDGWIATMTNPGKGIQKADELFKGPTQFSAISSEPLAPYYPFSGYTLGCFSGGAYCFQKAVQFTATSTANSKSVTLGLAAFNSDNYTYQADVSIYSDDGGVPGSALGTKKVTAASDISKNLCCSLTTAKIKVPLVEGTKYWIVVSPHHGLTGASDQLLWYKPDTDMLDGQVRANWRNNGNGWVSFQDTPQGGAAAAVK